MVGQGGASKEVLSANLSLLYFNKIEQLKSKSTSLREETRCNS